METQTFLNNFTTLVTVVSSIVAIAAVSICAILTAIITQRGIRKTKHSEMLFRETVKAYYDYLRAIERLINQVDLETLTKFSEASTRAMLFASEETKEHIAQYSLTIQSVTSAYHAYKPISQETISQLGNLKGQLIKSMQNDLNKN